MLATPPAAAGTELARVWVALAVLLTVALVLNLVTGLRKRLELGSRRIRCRHALPPGSAGADPPWAPAAGGSGAVATWRADDILPAAPRARRRARRRGGGQPPGGVGRGGRSDLRTMDGMPLGELLGARHPVCSVGRHRAGMYRRRGNGPATGAVHAGHVGHVGHSLGWLPVGPLGAHLPGDPTDAAVPGEPLGRAGPEEPIGLPGRTEVAEPAGRPRRLAMLVPRPRHGRSPSPGQRRRLRAAARRIAGAPSRPEVGQLTAQEGRELVRADTVAVVVRTVEGPRVLWQEPGGPEPAAIWGPATLGALLTLGYPVREVIPGDPLAAHAPTALLMVPVPAAGALIGAVLARREAGRPFTPADEDALARLARSTGTALDAVRRRGGVQASAGADRVTGLPGRERLLEDLRTALATLSSHGMPVTLVLARLDGLLDLRAALGRVAADQTLAVLAAGLVERLRVGDCAYRYGEDVLAFVLPGTTQDEAAGVLARLSEVLAAATPHALSGITAVPAQAAATGAPAGGVPTGGVPARGVPAGGVPARIALRGAVVPLGGVAEDLLRRAGRALGVATRAGRRDERQGERRGDQHRPAVV